MDNLCLIILTIALSDSSEVIVNDTINTEKSMLFKSEETLKGERLYKYKHQQGFFCDFEDRINENRKINLNIGIGDQ